MKRKLKYFLFAVLILIFPFIPSCHNKNKGLTEESAGQDSLNALNDEKKISEIIISKEQFESSGMKMGDPLPMIFQKKVSANGYIVASPSGYVKINTLIPGRVKQINRS